MLSDRCREPRNLEPRSALWHRRYSFELSSQTKQTEIPTPLLPECDTGQETQDLTEDLERSTLSLSSMQWETFQLVVVRRELLGHRNGTHASPNFQQIHQVRVGRMICTLNTSLSRILQYGSWDFSRLGIGWKLPFRLTDHIESHISALLEVESQNLQVWHRS